MTVSDPVPINIARRKEDHHDIIFDCTVSD